MQVTNRATRGDEGMGSPGRRRDDEKKGKQA
jgi:hypothetical protein